MMKHLYCMYAAYDIRENVIHGFFKLFPSHRVNVSILNQRSTHLDQAGSLEQEDDTVCSLSHGDVGEIESGISIRWSLVLV